MIKVYIYIRPFSYFIFFLLACPLCQFIVDVCQRVCLSRRLFSCTHMLFLFGVRVRGTVCVHVGCPCVSSVGACTKVHVYHLLQH
jgi:hypothetical protein